MRRVLESREELEFNGTYQLLVYVDNINVLDENMNIIKRNTEGLLQASRKVGLEVKREREN
jgi:hypothetical protein